MPVSLEQWRASVGVINAGRSRVLAKCIKGSPRSGSNLDLILFLLVMAPLVMCCCVGAWLVVKWGAPVKHGQLLKRYRREDALRQCLLLGIVCCEGWLLSLQCAHGEGVWSHETPMTCPSVSSNHLSPLSGCGQYLNVAFHTVMVTLLYLCGDVEKNPGPPFDLIPDNLGKVRDLIISAQTKWIDLGLELHIKMTELEVIEKDRHDVDSRFREMLRTWLKMVDPSPSWEGLIVALEKESVGCDDVAEVVRQMLGVMKPIPESDPTATGYQFGRDLFKTRDMLRLDLKMVNAEQFDRNDDFLDVMDAVFTLAADWEKIAMKLHLRYDTISAIQKDNPGDTHACLEKAISQWLKENYNIAKFGVPSWRTLVTAVETIDIGLANDIAESHKVGGLESDEEDAKKLFDEAMKKGHVTSQSVVIILNGIAGSGKSCFKRLVLNLDHEEKRVSTGLAEGAIRNVSTSRATFDDPKSVEWKVKDSQALLTMVADVIKERKSKTPAKHQLVVESGGSIVESSSDDDDYISDDEIAIDNNPILPLIRKSLGSELLFNVRWVYLIDTGGQPQFLHLLPAFIKDISSCACVCFVRLDQGLEHKPMVEFFNKSGTQCGGSYKSEHTHLQVIQSCASTIHSKCSLNSEHPPSFFVVGTHLDEYENNLPPETIAMKNNRLTTQLYSLLQQSLKLYKGSELIFPLNCKNPKECDQSVAAEFRKCVMKHCLEPANDIPLAWFVLEEHIRQHADQEKKAYIEKTTCLKIASKLKMSRTAFQAALNHLLKLNIFRCYPSSPNLIFCDTHVVLLKLTELVQHGFELRGGTICGLDTEDISFMNEGIISKEYLSRFPQFFSGMFTEECFLNILTDLLAVADVDNGKYFMPCLLKQLSGTDFNEYRTHSESLSSLLLYLDSGCLPNGLFTSLIASLKNNHQWALSKKYGRVACLYQNCVSFKIPKGSPGVVTLIASFNFIEVHLNCSFEFEIDNACINVFSDIRSGLQASWETLYPGKISFKPGFFCTSCTSSDSCPADHYATVNDGGRFTTCSQDDNCVRELFPSEVRWLKNTSSKIMRYLEKYDITSSLHLEKTLDWDNGVEKDLIEIAKDMTEWQVNLVSPLELTHTEVSDIEEKYPRKPELQRQEVLHVWKSKSGLEATYKNLLRIFVTAGHDAGAKAVCEVLQKKGYNTTQPIAHPQESYLAHGTTPQASPEIPAVLKTEISSSKLNIIKWRAPSGEEKVLRLKKEMSVKWRELGQNVKVSDADLIGFRQSHLDLEDRMDAVTQKWIQNGSKNIKYPANWEGLVTLLRDVELNSLADQIIQAAADTGSTLYEN